MDVSTEYAKRLTQYMKRFGLYSVDIAHLADTTSDIIIGILSGEKGLVLITLENIANIFGLRYFEFGNPKHPIPSFSQLPEDTQLRIKFRKDKGKPEKITYKQSPINEHIQIVLGTYALTEEILIEDVIRKIKEKYDVIYKPGEISDRFKKTFKSIVQETGKRNISKIGPGPKPKFYKLIRIPTE
ncbi:hypothetical protein [Pedobacter sp. BMA]|uniref:hypothetical protein n=1 Tax=Pedobacter sp. BMA TaxID=1663685 RepID=UPI00064B6450|nr:hypothetical protein [Pedobacter sp. BMA]KLT64733.1 hypothetical protein AB669_13370 [Pedobacter sp. BMA]